VLNSASPLGRTTVTTYNKRGQLLTITLPVIAGQPAVITNVYDNAGNLQSTTDSRDNITSRTWNALAKPVTVTSPPIGGFNNVVSNVYDRRDWLDTTTNSLSHFVDYDYDSAGRTTKVKDPILRITESTFDANGRVIEVKDPLARVVKQIWNARGEKNRDTDGLNQNTDHTFDNNGNRITLKNRRFKEYSFAYDKANRLISTTTPTGKITSQTYFKNNLLKTVTEPSTQTNTLAYDQRLRVQSRTDNQGATTYGYDHDSNLLTVTEGAAVITRTYDERNRLKTFTNADGDLVKYDYDATNNLTRITYPPDAVHPTGKQVNYTYNARNLLETVTDWAGRVTTYQYDRLGRLLRIINANGTSTVRELDAAGQLLSQREIITATSRIFHFQKFSYDAAGQVSNKFTAPAGYPWTDPGFTGTYDDDNRLLTTNGGSVMHDADGNMTSGPITASSGTQTLVYNARNQLTSAVGVTYTYDAEGRRRTMVQGTNTTRYTIDPNGTLSRLLVKHNPDGTKTYYIYGLGLLYEASKIGTVAETTITHHYDQVGSTTLRTDSTGNDIGRAEYSPYGICTWKTGNMNTPFLYNGGYGVMSDANGLICMRARYYSPYLMRFLNADPIGFSGGSNWFAYADGNPITAGDPLGLATILFSSGTSVNVRYSGMADRALEIVGSANYSRWSQWNGQYFGQHKCNCFTYDVAEASGLIPPTVTETIRRFEGASDTGIPFDSREGEWVESFESRPARPSEFINPDVYIPGWSGPEVVTNPQRGAMISNGQHIGIATGPDSTASVLSNAFVPTWLSGQLPGAPAGHVVNNDWPRSDDGTIYARYPTRPKTEMIATTSHK
jgi:RHS repeat-associated protein